MKEHNPTKLCYICWIRYYVSDFYTYEGKHDCCKACFYTYIRVAIKPIKPNKVCSRCKREKRRIEFTKDKNKVDGYNIYCRRCIKEKRIKYKEMLESQYICQICKKDIRKQSAKL